MKKISNKTLKKSLDVLTQKVFTLYNQEISKYGDITDSLQLFQVINQLEAEVKKLAEFKKCVEIMNKSPKISLLLGKLVGTTLSMSGVQDASGCITRFIDGIYLKDKIFSSDLFERNYERFEELFYSNNLSFIDTVRLYNFESEIEEILLKNGLAIKKVPLVVDEQTRIQEMQFRPHAHFSESDFVIERKYSKPKLVGEQKNDEDTINRESRESGDLFDLVIKSLRILNTSAVYRSHIIQTETLTYMPYGGIMSRFPFFENTVLGEKCKLSKKEAKELKGFFTKIIKIDSTAFKIASNRLGFGLERKSDEDKLLDYMIGLESLYLPDGNDELTFRLSLRIAFVVEVKMKERKKTFKFIKKMYGIRSKIAHGKKYELTKADLVNIEYILRKSLKIWLDTPKKFQNDKYDNKGELVKEGYLDNAYFKK